MVIAPSALYIGATKAALRGDVKVAVQDIHTAKGFGAFTGSVTAEQVKGACGC